MELLRELLPFLAVAVVAFLFGRPTKQDKHLFEMQDKIDRERREKIDAIAEAKKQKLLRENLENSYRSLSARIESLLRRADAKDDESIH
jgi:hypothetical protein